MKAFQTPLKLAIAVVALASFSPATAQVALYYDQADFLGDGRVTGADVLIFDGFGAGADLTGAMVGGMTLNAPGVSPLLVIDADAGLRGSLMPRSANTVLSPGGSNLSLENDDLEIVFAAPVQFFGLDVVFDVPDASFTSATFYDMSGAVLAQNSFIPDPNFARDYQFVGAVSDSANIARVLFDEFDPSPGDDHIAYDNFIGPAVVVPEPGGMTLLGLGLAAIVAAARRRRRA